MIAVVAFNSQVYYYNTLYGLLQILYAKNQGAFYPADLRRSRLKLGQFDRS